MYLYNISLIIENEQHEPFMQWLQNEWIENLPAGSKLLKMLDSPHQGQTYCVQLNFEYANDIANFQKQYLSSLQQHIGEHFMGKVFLFDSTMKYLEK